MCSCVEDTCIGGVEYVCSCMPYSQAPLLESDALGQGEQAIIRRALCVESYRYSGVYGGD